MKKRAIILSVAMLLTAAAGCFAGCGKKNSGGGNNNNNNQNPPSGPVAGTPVTDPDQHLVSSEKTLHIKNVTPSSRVFVDGGTTEYRIITGSGASEVRTAASFLQGQIGDCTGVYPQLSFDADQNLIADDDASSIRWDDNKKYIVLAHDVLEEEAHVTWQNVELGYSGYMIKTVGNSVFFHVNTAYGYQQAAQCFLREVLGYDYISLDMIIFEKDGKTMPDLDIIERPDFDFVDRSWVQTVDMYPTGKTGLNIFVYPEGNHFVHNSFVYLPPETHQGTHPKWYATNTGNNGRQLCYSAHGDQAEYDAMLEAAFESVWAYVVAQPNAATVTFTHQDAYDMCGCPACHSAKAEYGSITSTILMFINDLDDKLQEALEADAEAKGTTKREITVLFFAYLDTIAAPVWGDTPEEYRVATTTVKDVEIDGETVKRNFTTEDGTEIMLPYHQAYDKGMYCNEHVGLFYAPIGADFTHSFYVEDNLKNRDAREVIEKWGLVTNRMYAWIYDTQFGHYILPYNSYDAIPETLRYLKDHNCMYVFNQAQGTSHGNTNAVVTGFGQLKNYLNLSLPRDVNQDANALTKKFFKYYFGDAANIMTEYFESLVMHMRRLESDYPSVFGGHVGSGSSGNIESPDYWPLALMNNFISYCNRAYAAIAKYELTNPAYYEVLRNHITIETIFPRLMICHYYSGYYSQAQLKEMRLAVIADCAKVGIEAYNENVSLKAQFFDKWNVL